MSGLSQTCRCDAMGKADVSLGADCIACGCCTCGYIGRNWLIIDCTSGLPMLHTPMPLSIHHCIVALRIAPWPRGCSIKTNMVNGAALLQLFPSAWPGHQPIGHMLLGRAPQARQNTEVSGNARLSARRHLFLQQHGSLGCPCLIPALHLERLRV